MDLSILEGTGALAANQSEGYVPIEPAQIWVLISILIIFLVVILLSGIYFFKYHGRGIIVQREYFEDDHSRKWI
jgi:hypothetical protein